MLKMKLSKSAWEKLTPAVQELYKADGDSYALQVKTETTDDIGPLTRAHERLKIELKDERDARKELENKLTDLDTNDARKSGDIDKLTKQWDAKFATAEAEHKAEVDKLHNHIRETTIDSVVTAVASRNTASKENAALLDPHLRQKLSVEFTDEGPQVMMNVDGANVPLDEKKFENTVVDNPAFAAIIVGNRASGGSASDDNSQNPKGSAFPTDNKGQGSEPVDLSAVSPQDLVKMLPAP